MVYCPGFMKSILPQKSLSLISARLLSIDSTSDLCHSQLWALNLVTFQFFIKSRDGKYILFWVQATDHVKKLQHNIMHTLGISMILQSLIFGGKSMQDDVMLQYYNILLSSTIILNMRLRGGSPRTRNSKGIGGVSGSIIPKGTKSNQGKVNGGFSYIDILKGKFVASTTPYQTHNIPNPYIVEQVSQIPVMTIDLP